MRLDKCIADHSAYSRKEVKELLRRGSVRVNSAPEQDPGRQVDPEGDEIMLAGVILPTALHRTYMLNKPKGCISSTRTGKTKTVVEFLPPELRKGIFPAGRLDVDTEGMLLLTNDGDLINAMMRGANRHEKEYIVKIDREITPDFLEIMRKGIYLKDLDITTRECKIEKIGKYTFQIILTQGVNRQIRRMCEACGAKVRSLKRIRVMNIRLGDLKPGEWREVTGEELETLLTDTGMLNRK